TTKNISIAPSGMSPLMTGIMDAIWRSWPNEGASTTRRADETLGDGLASPENGTDLPSSRSIQTESSKPNQRVSRTPPKRWHFFLIRRDNYLDEARLRHQGDGLHLSLHLHRPRKPKTIIKSTRASNVSSCSFVGSWSRWKGPLSKRRPNDASTARVPSFSAEG